MQKANELYKNEINELKRQLEEVSHLDRSLHMPRPMTEAEVQVSGVNLTAGANLLRNERSPVVAMRQ